MRALAKLGPRKGLELVEKELPRPVGRQALIEVVGSSICGTDIHLYDWDDYCKDLVLEYPRIIGHETVGRVVAIGPQVRTTEVGDIVSAESHIFCGECPPCKAGRMELCKRDWILGENIDGAFAENLLIEERYLWRHPQNVDLTLACICEPVGNAVNVLTHLDADSHCAVVIGAGPIGLFSVALAREFGVERVLVVEPSPARAKLAMHLGADAAIDPGAASIPDWVLGETGGEGADVCLEMSGSTKGVLTALECVKPGGLVVGFGLPNGLVPIDYTRRLVLRGVRLVGVTGRRVFDTWRRTAGLIGPLGEKLRAVVTHSMPFTDFERAFEAVRARDCGKVLLWFHEG